MMTAAIAPPVHAWPKALLKAMIRLVLRVLYRVEVHGLEHARAAQSHAVIAANHASFLDALVLGTFLTETPIFAIDTFVYLEDRRREIGLASRLLALVRGTFARPRAQQSASAEAEPLATPAS